MVTAPNTFLTDITATKKIGKVEFGLVAYTDTDLNSPTLAYKKQRSASVGGLLAYDFDAGFTVQARLQREVLARNYGGGYETRGWLVVILPLYSTPATPAAIKQIERRS